jgi:uncharacterized membrane protein
VAALEGPARLKLWVEVFQGFFRWVWVAVILLPISGVGMLHCASAALKPRRVMCR